MTVTKRFIKYNASIFSNFNSNKATYMNCVFSCRSSSVQLLKTKFHVSDSNDEVC